MAQTLMGWRRIGSQAAGLEANQYSVEETRAIASFLQMDNIFYVLRAPVYAKKGDFPDTLEHGGGVFLYRPI